MRISKKEIFLACLLAILACIFFFTFSGGPQGSDEIGYMNNGLNNIKSDLIPNRYFHVYLQKLFMAVAPDPITGAAAMWSFLMASSGLLIYFCARLFSPNNTPIHGLIGVGLFSTSTFLGINAGSTTVDFTAMTMVLLVLALFIVSCYQEHQKPWLLALIGFTYFLAFKSKETSLLIGVLLIGLGFDEAQHFNPRLLGKRFLYVLPGIAAGFVFFMILNAIFLKDALFGLLPSSLMAVYDIYDKTITYHPDPGNWYTEYILEDIQIAAVLYIASLGRSNQPRIRPDLRLTWLYPLLLVFFLTLSMIRSEWGVLMRYFFPGQMIIYVLAPQFLDIKFPENRKEWLRGLGVLAVSLGIWFACRTWALQMTSASNWEYQNFIETILNPLLLSILLGLVLMVQRFDYRTLPVLLVALFVVTYHPILENYRTLAVLRTPQTMNIARFTPFSIYKDEIEFNPDMQMYVSADIAVPMQIHVNRDEIMCMFNVYFRAASVRENFTFSPEDGTIPADLLSQGYQYILITQSQWETLQAQLDPSDPELSNYDEYTDVGGVYFLLKQTSNQG